MALFKAPDINSNHWIGEVKGQRIKEISTHQLIATMQGNLGQKIGWFSEASVRSLSNYETSTNTVVNKDF